MVASLILGLNGKPYQNGSNGHKPRAELVEAFNTSRLSRREINARYDAASGSKEFANYWSKTDRLDADAANSRMVRETLVKRSRYEVENNGFADGIAKTYCTDIVGCGPSLRMMSPNVERNQEVEASWRKWSKIIKLRRKLWCMCHAKVKDGEGFGVLRQNAGLRHQVKLDLVLFETEQCQTPIPTFEDGHIDGITFDKFGNVLTYSILKHHPGAQFTGYQNVYRPEEVPARFVLHWFALLRPGQHRGIPEMTSTLQVGAASRRLREAVVAGAEVAADISLVIHTNILPDGEAEAIKPGAINFEKRMMVAVPEGWTPTQMKSEQPFASYDTFMRGQVSESARPLSMPYNKAACDSSQANFASGQLDHIPYYDGIDVQREDANDLVLDGLFSEWWREYVLVNELFDEDANEPPEHKWDWPEHKVANEEARASARDKNLKNGSMSYGEAASVEGKDFEERVVTMATEYGLSVDAMRDILLKNNFSQAFLAQAQLDAQQNKSTDTKPAVDAGRVESSLLILKSLASGDINAASASKLLEALCHFDPQTAKAVTGGQAA